MNPGNCLLAVLVLASATATAAARADLHFTQPRADLGEVRTCRTLTHRFAFVNQGPEAVEVCGARTTCGCLAPRLERRTYQPGEAGEVVLDVNTLSAAPGPQTWRVQLTCRRGDTQHEIALQVSATVVAEVRVRPAALVLPVDQPVAHDLTVTDSRARPLTVLDVRASSPRLRPKLTGHCPDARGQRVANIRLEAEAAFPEGRHAEILTIYTDDLEYRELQVPLTVVKRGRQRLSAAPAEVKLSAPAGQPLPSRIVLLRDRDNQAVQVEKVETDDPAILCRWAAGPNNLATLRIQVDRARIAGATWQSAVHVHVSHPVREVVTIPVTCSAP